MYSPNSSIFSSINEHPLSASAYLNASSSVHHQPNHQLASPSSNNHAHPNHATTTTPTTISSLTHAGHQTLTGTSGAQCLRFKYFATFFICTTCLALLSASLATHKWIVSKPIRILRLNNTSSANLTALMLTMANDDDDSNDVTNSRPRSQQGSSFSPNQAINPMNGHGNNHFYYRETLALLGAQDSSFAYANSPINNNKFQGEIYFGLFNGVKVLNYGFGDRVSQISVVKAYFQAKDTDLKNQLNHHELVNFKFWLPTLVGVVLAILFALIGSIFAIINFVISPRSTLTGPVGLVIWNASACSSCLLAIVSWFIEYFIRLKANVLTQEEVQNGWTSESRSQFGYSYYFVVLAFVLHLVNIFIVSLLQFETWNSSKAAMRQSRSACEGVIMLY